MKRIYTLWLILLAAALSSCNAWLDVDLINQSEEADLFSTERGFAEALAGVYYDMSAPGLYGQNLTFGMLDIMSRTYDYSLVPNAQKIYRDYNYKDQDMQMQGYSLWLSMYANIAALNNILAWSEKNASVLRPAYLAQMRGEALALRAWHHFDLYRLFAPDVKQDPTARILPYQDVFGVETPPVYATQDYLNLVVKDLKAALDLLQGDPIREVVPYTMGNGPGENKDQADLYVARMNYFAVKALLARVYLNMGGAHKAEARTLAQEVIDSGKFALLDYQKSINVETADKDLLFSDGHIFSLRNKSIKTNAEGFHRRVTGSDGNFQMPAGFQNILYEGDMDDCRLNWFRELYIVKYTSDNSRRFSPKVPLLRLSEMYLIAAEAWMDDDPAQAATLLQTFKQSRTKKEVPLQEVTQEVILREIRKEFVGEGHLFFAYKRLNHDIIGNTSEDHVKAAPGIFTFPLPQDEIEYGNRTK